MTAVFSDQLTEDQIPAGIMTNASDKCFRYSATLPSKTVAKCSHQVVTCADAEDTLKTVYSIAKQNRDKKVVFFFSDPAGAPFYYRALAKHQVYGYVHHVCVNFFLKKKR